MSSPATADPGHDLSGVRDHKKQNVALAPTYVPNKRAALARTVETAGFDCERFRFRNDISISERNGLFRTHDGLVIDIAGEEEA